ncbi:hypothetical protein Tco_1100048 [Tanacetum coccineum]
MTVTLKQTLAFAFLELEKDIWRSSTRNKGPIFALESKGEEEKMVHAKVDNMMEIGNKDVIEKERARLSKIARCSMGWKSFSLIFIASLIGVTGNQMIQYEGIYLASSPAASALSASIIGDLQLLSFVKNNVSHTKGPFGLLLGITMGIGFGNR